MKLLFKQRFFSWFDSYDIYNEAGDTIFTVKGRLAWGHCLEIFDASDKHVGTLKEEVFTFLPKFAMYINDEPIGEIRKEFTFFRPQFTLDCNNWEINGDLWEWNYTVTDTDGTPVMHASKELFNWTDTYVIDVTHPEHILLSLMIVLAIDAAKCSSKD